MSTKTTIPVSTAQEAAVAILKLADNNPKAPIRIRIRNDAQIQDITIETPYEGLSTIFINSGVPAQREKPAKAN